MSVDHVTINLLCKKIFKSVKGSSTVWRRYHEEQKRIVTLQEKKNISRVSGNSNTIFYWQSVQLNFLFPVFVFPKSVNFILGHSNCCVFSFIVEKKKYLLGRDIFGSWASHPKGSPFRNFFMTGLLIYAWHLGLHPALRLLERRHRSDLVSGSRDHPLITR